MVRILVERTFDKTKKYIEAYGLSTDTKPTANLVTGSFFMEVDTGKSYLFDEVTGDGTWHEVGGSDG